MTDLTDAINASQTTPTTTTTPGKSLVDADIVAAQKNEQKPEENQFPGVFNINVESYGWTKPILDIMKAPPLSTNPNDLLNKIIGENPYYKKIKGTLAELPSSRNMLRDNSIDPASIYSLASSGATEILSALTGKTGASLIGTIASIVGPVAFKKLSTYKEFEKILGDTKNLKENLNPLGFDIRTFLNVGSLIEQLLLTMNEKDATEKANQDAIKIDACRQEIYTLNSDIEEFYTLFFDLVANVVMPKVNAENDFPILKKLLYKFEQLYTTNEIIYEGTIKDQLIDLRGFLVTTVSTMHDVFNRYSFEQEILRRIDDKYNKINAFVLRIDNLIETYGNMMEISIENIKDLRKSNGIFVAKGVDQQTVNYRLSDDSSGFRNLLMYSWLRNSYVKVGHTSVSKLASPFGYKGETPHDKLDKIESTFPKMETAVTNPGATTKAQIKGTTPPGGVPVTETTAAHLKGAVGPLDENDFEKYKFNLSIWESTHRYNLVNPYNYMGRWQFGAPALNEIGHVRSGTINNGLKIESNWTKNHPTGVMNHNDWLANKNNCQDIGILKFTRIYYARLLKMGVLSRSDNKATVAGYLAAAHLLGCGGARNLKNGHDGADANGTKASKYRDKMSAVFAGS